MIRTLEFDVTFSDGKRLHGKHRFEKGTTVIHGPNERGKSFRIEMIRYALFGAKALRGKTTAYKSIMVEVEVTIRGHDYTIRRKGSTAKVWRGEQLLATGTNAVNNKVRELLGYDLTVFDMANHCQQGEIEALSKMRPTQRKAMVDQTVGLNVVDDLIKMVGEWASAARKQGDAIQSVLVRPTEPEQPENYMPSEQLRPMVEDLQKQVQTYRTIKGWLSSPAPEEPVRPQSPCKETAKELEQYQKERRELEQALSNLEGQLQHLPTSTHTEAELDALEGQLRGYESYCAMQERLAAWKEPAYSRDQLARWKLAWEFIRQFAERDRLRAQIDTLKGRGTHTCPKCEHTWALEQETIENLQAAENEFRHLDDLEAPMRPPISVEQIEKMEREHEEYEAGAAERATLSKIPAVEDPGLTQRQIDQLRNRLEQSKRRPALEEHLKTLRQALADKPDRSALLQQRTRYETLLSQYDSLLEAYNLHMQERMLKEERLQELEGCEQLCREAQADLAIFEGYERDLARYRKEAAAYEEHATKAKAFLEEAEQLDRARKALRTLKTEVKQYLVPSLNRVASHLLTQMTGGVRNLIKVDEDFEIQVDGNSIDTLSGSGKAVSNLAIRLGLGQILTNGVFSVFMGDEIDASMDQERANYTVECLRNLSSKVEQVVLVSHKEIEGDHSIRL